MNVYSMLSACKWEGEGGVCVCVCVCVCVRRRRDEGGVLHVWANGSRAALMSFLDAWARCQSCAALNPGERPLRLLSLSTTMHWQSIELIQDSEVARWCFVLDAVSPDASRVVISLRLKKEKKERKRNIQDSPTCCFWEVSASELLQ